MIVYKEEKIGQQSIFIKTVLNEQHQVVSERIVSIPLYQVVQDYYTYFILYDDKMKPYTTVYDYLNFKLRESPLTSRSQSAVALRLLYCFLSLSGYKIYNFNGLIFKELLFFLRGINSNPDDYAMQTQRTNNTVNGYLSVYRSYFGFIGVKCDSLFRAKESLMSYSFDGDFGSVSRKKYVNNLPTMDKSETSVPRYIGKDDFVRLWEILVAARDEQAQIIVLLMYGYGLRLGEVLGLTIEDIREIRDNGKLIPVLLLRNRLSDAKYQFAKGLPHVIDPREYSSSDYQKSSQKIIITYQLYEELIDFIERKHNYAIEHYSSNYDKGIADIVSLRNKPDENHYVFLNRYGRVLSDQTWNNHLRKYFIQAGIPIDSDIRENNLSHRFRHGFAMFHARFRKNPLDALALQKLMRHKSISSTMVYYNPTEEDEYKTKTEFQQELYELIPQLKEGFYGI